VKWNWEDCYAAEDMAGSDHAWRYGDRAGTPPFAGLVERGGSLFCESSNAVHGSFVFARHFCVPSVLEEGWLPVHERVIDGLLVRHERLLSTYYAFSYIACF
jgi:hypothetical protein